MKDDNIFLAEKLKTDVRKSENVKVSFFNTNQWLIIIALLIHEKTVARLFCMFFFPHSCLTTTKHQSKEPNMLTMH